MSPIIGTVSKTHAGAGQNQKAANPEWRRGVSFRRLEKPRIFDHNLDQQQQQSGKDEPDDGRNQQRPEDRSDLRPVNA
jgi:hypothetical protein